MRYTARLVAVVALCVVVGAGSLGAQGRPGRGRGLSGPGALTDAGAAPAEIQRLFDAYLLMQAQQALQLTDDQFPRFLARVRTLQEVRRRGQIERGRLLRDLRRLSEDPAGSQDEPVRAQLKALAELEGRLVAEVRQALDGVDQVLDLRQQVRFRLFEEQMERRKVELMMRARQANRAGKAPQP